MTTNVSLSDPLNDEQEWFGLSSLLLLLLMIVILLAGFRLARDSSKTAKLLSRDAEIINASGRQRMLTTRAELRSKSSRGTAPESRKQWSIRLRETLQEITANHKKLQSSQELMNNPLLWVRYEPKLLAYYDQVREVLKTGETPSEIEIPALEELSAPVEQLDQIVAEFEAGSRKRLNDFQRNSNRFAYLSIIGSAAIAFSIAGITTNVERRRRKQFQRISMQLDTQAKSLAASLERVREEQRQTATVTAQLRAVLDASTHVGIIAIDAAGQVIVFNPGAEKLLGYEPDEVLHKATPRLWQDPDEIRRRAEECGLPLSVNFIALAQLRHPYPYWTLVRKDGQRRQMMVQISPLQIPDQTPGHLGVIVDVTEQVAMNERMVEKTAELEKTNRDLEEFTHVASHDLKSPLRAISSLASFLREDVGDRLPAEATKHLDLIDRRVKRMSALLDGLLQYAHTGKRPGLRERVDTREVIDAVCKTLHIPDGFTIQVEGDFPVLNTFEVPLEMCLRNLIGNSIKHHDRNGGIIRVIGQITELSWCVTISDDGPGIPERYHEKIFQMFQTLRRRDEVEGSGMGLALVKRTVQSLGGSIKVTSPPSSETTPVRGCSFVLAWPHTMVAS